MISTEYGKPWGRPGKKVIPLSRVRPRWAGYNRDQEAVAAAIARKEYTDLTPTGVGVVDEFFALMDQVGILDRLAVEGVYQRRMVPMVLMMTTYCAKVIMGLTPALSGGSCPPIFSAMPACCVVSALPPSKWRRASVSEEKA
jgi:hypothetical protein